jgi:H2-forming N5,N10-methylenetetrahydromethanopterin dehydrogenase-like enzyme
MSIWLDVQQLRPILFSLSVTAIAVYLRKGIRGLQRSRDRCVALKCASVVTLASELQVHRVVRFAELQHNTAFQLQKEVGSQTSRLLPVVTLLRAS